MWLPILSFVTYCGVLSNAFIVAYTSDFCTQLFVDTTCTSRERLAIALVFEHIALISMYLIKAAVPDKPSAIRLAQRRVSVCHRSAPLTVVE